MDVPQLDLFLLFEIPQFPRQDPAAERTIVQPHILVSVVAEHEEVLGVDFRDDGAVG
jgi:hypothetical protein